jgi:hypothetical protein
MRGKKIYTAQFQYQLCTKLSITGKSLTNITSTPTKLIDVVTDMETLGSVTDFPNKTDQSEFSSNIDLTSSRDSTIQENLTASRRQRSQNFSPKNQYEGVNESTKGGDEDITSDETTKPPGTYDSEESNESGEEANTIKYVLLCVLLFVALVILCGVTWLIVLYLTRESFPLVQQTIADPQEFFSPRNRIGISHRREQNSSNSAKPLVRKDKKRTARS